MSFVTVQESITTGVMQARLVGDSSVAYVETDYQGNAWRCEGCGLVWEKRWYAETCDKRDHKPSFVQRYFRPGSGPMGNATVNGVYQGTVSEYTRQSLRRD